MSSTSSSVSGRGMNTGGAIFSDRSRKSHSRMMYWIGMRARRHSHSSSIFTICVSLSEALWCLPTSPGPASCSTCAMMFVIDVSGSGTFSDSNRFTHFSCAPCTVDGRADCAATGPVFPLYDTHGGSTRRAGSRENNDTRKRAAARDDDSIMANAMHKRNHVLVRDACKPSSATNNVNYIMQSIRLRFAMFCNAMLNCQRTTVNGRYPVAK
uniref:Uncharacterized protein n=1 Tax=Anopheles atroparvus TaxID=41427 RepID=A0A182JGC9_ANOAO